MSNESHAAKPMLIGGEWIGQTTGRIESVNPANGEINHEVCAAGVREVDLAVGAATQASRLGTWTSMLGHQRAVVLHRIGDLLAADSARLSRLQMIENGKILSECKAQVASAAATFRYYAAVCETVGEEITPARGNYLSMVVHEPYGVVAAITPWNSPLTMEAQKVAPALAAGNAVVLKPSEVTPSLALELGRIALAAGLPAGMLNVIPGTGSIAGAALVSHPGVGMVSFTGGTASGRSIAQIAAARLMPAALELGGKSPHVVFEDADIEAAVEAVCGGIFEGSGQSCVAGSRLFVQRSILDAFLEKLLATVARLRVDLPDSPGAQMGPIASFGHRERIEALVQDAVDEGAEVLAGAGRPSSRTLAGGAFYLPTILCGITSGSAIVQREIFGPVLCAMPFDDEDDVVTQANDSVFGLAAGLWTRDYGRAWRVARRLAAGTVWINTYKQLSISTPFGGFKESGLGREKGSGGMRLYQQSKSIYLALPT